MLNCNQNYHSYKTYSESNHDYRVKMNVINYITITCNLKNVRLQITFDYMKNVIDHNRTPNVI
jgi:hypothetical protein